MADRPNILMMTCHDIGQHLGCYGVESVHTPNLDRLAGEGVRFERSFASAPTCSPSRASIFTGRWPHQTGVLGLCHGGYAWDMNRDEIHLARYLADAGYHTEDLGIMHEAHTIEGRGFDYLRLFDEHWRPSCDELVDVFAERLDVRAGGDRPWFTHIGFFEPHSPFDHGGATPDDSMGVSVPPWLVDEPSAQEVFAAYQGPIRKVDAAIGRVLDKLQAAGLAENTLVLYTADHGIPFPRAKASLYDPGLTVPLLIRWPARGWAGGKVLDPMVSNIDHVPTLLDTLGLDLPDRVEGRSYRPLLDGEEYTPHDAVFCEHTYHGGGMFIDPRRAVRTERYKLIANFSTNRPWVDRPGLRFVEAVSADDVNQLGMGRFPNIELYDLAADPLETTNLADDARHQQVSTQLRSRLLNWMRSKADPLLEGFPTPPTYDRTMAALREAAD